MPNVMNRRIADRQHDESATPVVSILCVTYNHESFVGECIEGFLKQEVDFPVEIIIHDDASTDRTQAILTDYASRHPGLFRLILREQNLRQRGGKAAPALIERARGRYIAWCDGDDYWTDPRKLALQTTLLEANPEYVASFHEASEVSEDGTMLRPFNLPERGRRDYSADDLIALRWGWILLSTMCFRNVLKDFPPEYFLVSNGDLFIARLLGFHGAAKYQGDAIRPNGYRQHPGGIWSMQPEGVRRRMHLLSHLQIVSFLVRIGRPAIAMEVFENRLIPEGQKYYKALLAGQLTQG
jgi:glycosyltransferase involved in cell wall biosynthesis